MSDQAQARAAQLDQALHKGAVFGEGEFALPRLTLTLLAGIEVGGKEPQPAAQAFDQTAPLPAVAEAAMDKNDGRPAPVVLIEALLSVDGDLLDQYAAL
jgi:hypothetical protein